MTPTDPLGVRTSCAFVMAKAQHVRIDQRAIERFVAEFQTSNIEPPGWDTEAHFQGKTDEQTAAWIFVLDALNFCFWSQAPDPNHRWRVTWNGETQDGYYALTLALRRAVAEGFPLHDPDWLANVNEADVADILRPAPACPDIPLFEDRVTHLRELGRGLLASPHRSFADLIAAEDHSAVELVRTVISRFPSFNDVATWQGQEVRFYKRAQILVSDLAGALAGRSLGTFHDLDQLTAFADYKVPQVLRRLGILAYAPSLSKRIQKRDLIPPGAVEEIEIRAATVVAVDRLQATFAQTGRNLTAAEIDWLLWTAGQQPHRADEPYHRTLTVFY